MQDYNEDNVEFQQKILDTDLSEKEETGNGGTKIESPYDGQADKDKKQLIVDEELMQRLYNLEFQIQEEKLKKEQIQLEVGEQKQQQQKQQNENQQQPLTQIIQKQCCFKCKKNNKGGKTCICVVPAFQRRNSIGSQGCQTCGCSGCSKEDFNQKKEEKLINNKVKKKISRSRSSSYSSQYSSRSPEKQSKIKLKNGCCKQCLKAFSQNGKACICQVPKRVRKQNLPPEGCNYCGCRGCNPEDTKGKSKRRSNSHSHSYSYSYDSESFSESYSPKNINNLDQTAVGKLIAQGQEYPPLLGFGIPQRTFSYLTGKSSKLQRRD